MWMLALLGCSVGGSEPRPVAEGTPASVERSPVPSRAAEDATPRLEVLHRRVSKGRRLPRHVSATWVHDPQGSALQVMLTGLYRGCAAAPSFSLVGSADAIRLLEEEAGEAADCMGSHTLMLQLHHQVPRDLTVTVVQADGTELGMTKVRADDH